MCGVGGGGGVHGGDKHKITWLFPTAVFHPQGMHTPKYIGACFKTWNGMTGRGNLLYLFPCIWDVTLTEKNLLPPREQNHFYKSTTPAYSQ